MENITLNKVFKNLIVCALLFLSSFVGLVGCRRGSQAISLDDTNSYVSVGELWDKNTSSINIDNLKILFKYVSGDEEANMATMTSLANSKRTGTDMQGN